MFRGVQYINMDAKGRFAMPTRQRERLLSQCDGQIVVTVDTRSSCLMIYPLPEWERVEQDIQNLPSMNQSVKRFQRLMLGHATDIDLDNSGRMLLPAPLRDYASLGKKLVLVGMMNKLELWSEELWQAEQALAEKEMAESTSDSGAPLPDELLSLNL